MKRLVITALSVALSLAGIAGVTAQEKIVDGIVTNADGSYVTSTAGVNPTANGEGGTIIYGDIYATDQGPVVIDPPVSIVEGGAAPAAPAPASEPVAAVPAEIASAPVTAVAAETDLDADNYPDALEWDLGIDPNNPDSDADGAADGDELNIYGTDPTTFDTDGDGVSDGEELFGIATDPLAWNDFTAPAETGSEALAQESATAGPAIGEFTQEATAPGQETTEILTATDGDASAVGTGSASAAPGTVTRPGATLLGPDGTYSVTDVAPANVSVEGDTEVLSPPAAPAEPAPAAAPASNVSCGSYASWYDAQVAYEAAGMTSADPSIVASLDPDYDGIACEEAM